jgi:hypothetical protein
LAAIARLINATDEDIEAAATSKRASLARVDASSGKR